MGETFCQHKRGPSPEIHFEDSDLFFFTLSTVVHVGAVTTKSVLVKSLCEAILVALKQSSPQAYSLWVSKFNTDRFIRGMRPLEIVVIFHFQ